MTRPAIAIDPKRFGRGRSFRDDVAPQAGWSMSDDMRLFATTFAAGFLFVSIFIA